MQEQLLAGYARADITPEGSVHMQGGDWRNRISTGVLDPLYATCIALTVGDETVLLYTTDTLELLADGTVKQNWVYRGPIYEMDPDLSPLYSYAFLFSLRSSHPKFFKLSHIQLYSYV